MLALLTNNKLILKITKVNQVNLIKTKTKVTVNLKKEVLNPLLKARVTHLKVIATLLEVKVTHRKKTILVIPVSQVAAVVKTVMKLSKNRKLKSRTSVHYKLIKAMLNNHNYTIKT